MGFVIILINPINPINHIINSNIEIRNSKQIQMTEIQNKKQYDKIHLTHLISN